MQNAAAAAGASVPSSPTTEPPIVNSLVAAVLHERWRYFDLIKKHDELLVAALGDRLLQLNADDRLLRNANSASDHQPLKRMATRFAAAASGNALSGSYQDSFAAGAGLGFTGSDARSNGA